MYFNYKHLLCVYNFLGHAHLRGPSGPPGRPGLLGLKGVKVRRY